MDKYKIGKTAADFPTNTQKSNIKSYQIVFVHALGRPYLVIEVLKQVNEDAISTSERREPVRAYRSRLKNLLDVMAVDQDG